MRRGLFAWLAVGAMLAAGLVAVAAPVQALTPEAALERLFRERPAKAEWFAPVFLAQVPTAQVDAIVGQFVGTYGEVESVRRDGAKFVVVLARAEVPAQVHVDAQGRIDGLFLEAPRSRGPADLQRAVGELQRLPGKVSVLVTENGREKAALKADEPLAVGSTFKLAVLAAIQDQVKAGKRAWDDVVKLRPEWKSLPSGFLQTWPDEAPLTLYSLAALMISQSDNTAADALLALAGREALEAMSPRNRPFLSTRDVFVLKAKDNQALRARFEAADAAGRRKMLPEIAGKPLPGVDAIGTDVAAPGIEWFFTARELCALMDKVGELPLMGINPGVARPQDWAKVAFKGGGEPGVLNLTTALVAKDGRRICVSATWNGEQSLDEQKFVLLYAGLLDAVR